MRDAQSEDLIDYYRQTHRSRIYGTSSVKYLRYLRPEIQLRAPTSVLDYGCGQSQFVDNLGLPDEASLLRFDPAIREYANLPAESVDLLVNIDVLEHIEEHDLDQTIAQMREVCRDAIIIVDTAPAKHLLPDGRNAHVTLQQAAWWHERLSRHFGALYPVATPRKTRAGFKTWQRPQSQWKQFAKLRLREEWQHHGRGLLGRHHPLWKVSTLHSAKEPLR
jgi:hypothetical protein